MTTERATSAARSSTGAGSAAGTGQAVGGSTDRLTTAAGDVAERAAETAQQQVSIRLNGQMSRAGDMLEQIASAIRDSGNQVRDQMPEVAGFSETAAEKVEEVSTFLRNHDMDDLLREAESFARRQPMVFIGGAIALGLLASRFLKAAPPEGGTTRAGREYDEGGYAGLTGTSRYGGR